MRDANWEAGGQAEHFSSKEEMGRQPDRIGPKKIISLKKGIVLTWRPFTSTESVQSFHIIIPATPMVDKGS